MEIGDHVIYVDETAHAHEALVTSVFGIDNKSALNVVYVSDDKDATDQYGRQLAQRACSVVHEDSTPAHGRFWKQP